MNWWEATSPSTPRRRMTEVRASTPKQIQLAKTPLDDLHHHLEWTDRSGQEVKVTDNVLRQELHYRPMT